MTFIIDDAFANKFLKESYRGPNYDKNCKEANKMRIHADGLDPKDLLSERRPHESQEVLDYRKKIYKAITKMPVDKTINVLMRIPQAEDWSINWQKALKPPKVRDGESLEEYTQQNFPFFNSVPNWLFSYAMRESLIDSNAVVFVTPLNENIKKNDYNKPYAWLYQSEHVLDFQPEQYAVLLSKKESEYKVSGAAQKGKIYHFVTDMQKVTYTQSGVNTFNKEENNHNIGYLPVFAVGGLFRNVSEAGVCYESFLAGMLPYLDEAVREYSDMQAEVVKHMHSEKWEYASMDCSSCSGTGKVSGNVSCDSCKGSGKMINSPYSVIRVMPANVGSGEGMPVTPPAGFIEKNIEIVKLQDERIQNHINRAYSAINFDFLSQVGLNQSGTAKELDRQELNSFIFSLAYHLVHDILNNIYFFINEYRYKTVIENSAERESMLPSINVPKKFDILNESFLIDEIQKAITAKVDPVIIAELQKEYASKKFNNNEDIRNIMIQVFDLDPFAGLTEDEKILNLSNGLTTKEDCIISLYILDFVKQAFEQDSEFKNKTLPERKKVMKDLAQVVITANSPKANVLSSVIGASDQVNDLEAQAKANLRGTVGGVTGILGIVTQVSQGVMDKESAIALVVEIYGLTPEVAAKIVGDPKVQPAQPAFNSF